MAGSLSVEDLSASLGGKPILKGVSFTSPGREWFGLLGANGSGKTTLLRTLSGRLAPAYGRIILNGVDVTGAPERRARDIGYAPPLQTLPGNVTAGELLTLVGRARRADPHEPSRLRDVLELDRLRDQRIDSMSSGMRQRLPLFVAFVGGPTVVLLDEPFNWLDPLCAFEAKECLTDLAKSTLIISALHDVATLSLRCSSGILLRDGMIPHRFSEEELKQSRTNLLMFENNLFDRLRAGQNH